VPDTLTLFDGTKLMFTNYLKIIRTKTIDFCKINDTLIPFTKVKCYTSNSEIYYNVKNNLFLRQQEKGGINIYENNYFQIGDTGKIQKMNYTDLYYALQSDAEALKTLTKGDKKLKTLKTLMLASSFSIANVAAISLALNNTNGVFGNNSLIGIIYVGASIAGSFGTFPVFVITGITGAVTGTRGGQKSAIRMYNNNWKPK
jgi:hypothetical protein